MKEIQSVLTLLIAFPSFAFVFYVLAVGIETPAIAYLSYVLSAYALVITITEIINIVKWVRGDFDNHPVVKRALSFPVVERYLSEKTFRAEVALYPSLLINLLYAGIKLYSGIRYARSGSVRLQFIIFCSQ